MSESIITEKEVGEMNVRYRADLDTGQHVVKSLVKEPSVELFVDWSPYLGHDWSPQFNTSMTLTDLKALAIKLVELPTGFSLQRQAKKVFTDRASMVNGELPVDWGFAEILSYASIISTGNKVRITGQDVGRGTFSHRHAIISVSYTHLTLPTICSV